MHYLLTPKGRKEIPAPANGTDFTLEELYNIIGCEYIDVLRLDEDTMMVFDEEAKLKDQEYNKEATRLAVSKGRISVYDHFVGNVVVCDTSMLK